METKDAEQNMIKDMEPEPEPEPAPSAFQKVDNPNDVRHQMLKDIDGQIKNGDVVKDIPAGDSQELMIEGFREYEKIVNKNNDRARKNKNRPKEQQEVMIDIPPNIKKAYEKFIALKGESESPADEKLLQRPAHARLAEWKAKQAAKLHHPHRMKVLRNATVREEPNKTSKDAGKHQKDTIIDIAEQFTGGDGITWHRTTTAPVGWIKMVTSKGMQQLEPFGELWSIGGGSRKRRRTRRTKRRKRRTKKRMKTKQTKKRNKKKTYKRRISKMI